MPGTNLSLMLFPQRWDGANLFANLLLLPNGDPTAQVPLISGHELPFAQAQPVLRAALLPGLASQLGSFHHAGDDDLYAADAALQHHPGRPSSQRSTPSTRL